ncbi:uroporphyrinogen-III synthase [Corynebacterium bovis]|uniref:uroporphyrinogen-III synthase n=1 Tax=Corynebacterium bovis TaxID=36808 RepID=UPI003138814C
MTTAGITPPGQGRVLFVGAGPGNPELLTVRARDVLENTAHAWVDPAVSTAVRSLIASALPVPQEKLDAAQQAWEAEVEAARESGARRRPPRPTPPTAAETVLVPPAGTCGDAACPGVDAAGAAGATGAAGTTGTGPGSDAATGTDTATGTGTATDAAASPESGPADAHVLCEAGERVEHLSAAELVRAMVAVTREGGDVVRLVAGNPVSNPVVMAELQEVAALGVEFQVVPGMTGGGAVPAFTGIGTAGGFTEADVRSGRATGSENGGDVDWDQLAAAPMPLILTAGPDDLPVIAGELTSRGLAASTPATVTVHGTTRRQRTYDTTLENLTSLPAVTGQTLRDEDLPDELVVTLGAQVGSRSKYSWWENRALYGWTVLVPRAKNQAGPMSARLAAHGAIPMEVPTISVEPPRSPAQMERAVKGLVDGRYHWIVFTSVNAVKAVWDKFTEFGLDARALAGVRVAAVGTKTAQAVRDLGITPELLPKDNARNASGLVDVFPPYDPDLDLVDRVLLPRADIATDVLVDGLLALGWEVEDVVAYRTVRAAPPSPEIRDMIKTGGFDAVCFTSSSTVKNLVGIAGKPHARTIIACIGPMAAQTAREHGLRVDVMPEQAGVPELVDALADHVAHLRAEGQLPAPRKRRRKRRPTTGA